MKKLVVILAAVAVIASACGGGEGPDAASTTPEPAPSSAAPFDRAFIDVMVPHHRSAIAMAREATRMGLTQPELIKIADDIVATQRQEIDQLLGWRQAWYGGRELQPEKQALEAVGVSMEDAGMMSGGMSLSAATDVDSTFATMMIAHHEGAIRIAKRAGERSRRKEIRTVAANIIAAQQREIRIMSKHVGGAMKH